MTSDVSHFTALVDTDYDLPLTKLAEAFGKPLPSEKGTGIVRGCDDNAYLGLLRPRGTMVVVGAPPEAVPVHAFSLIMGNRRLAGSLIGGLAETQEMLDHCAIHGIVSDIELIPIQQINEAR